MKSIALPLILLSLLSTTLMAENYQDDRSSPESLIRSLYNAINHHEYARAWSYYGEAPATDFTTYAKEEFEKGGLAKKREIFSALGQNFSIKDKKLFITNNEWFVPIEKAYPELEAEFKRLELNKNLDIVERNKQIASLILRWLPIVDDVRTEYNKSNLR